MQALENQHFAETNGIRLHYADYGSPDSPHTLILMHGLTANLHSFDGLVKSGLADSVRVIAVDLRGRGESDKPPTGYSMDDHARDILGLMDHLGLEKAVIGGHSFGGLVTMYTGATYPDRVEKMVIIDAGLMPPNVLDIIKPSLDRLGQTVPSLEAYLATMRKAPYYHDGFWVEELDAYYTADVEMLPDGSVKPRSTPEAIAEAAEKGLNIDWHATMAQASAPALLMYAPEGFGPPGSPPILTKEAAEDTASRLPNCRLQAMTGNHITMLFGENAPNVVQTVTAFVNG